MKGKKNNIILIGFMGSGKSTVGIRLSYRLRRVVEDTDKMIEKRMKKSIAEIFATEGEEYFRTLETKMLREAIKKKRYQIISVGGGTPIRVENRKLLKRLGTVIYLRVQATTVYERIKRDTSRPLLQTEKPLERIMELLDKRKEAYENCADIIIDVDQLPMKEVVELIANKLEERGVK